MTRDPAHRGAPVERYGFLDAPEGRQRRGLRINEAFVEFAGIDLGTARILDVGCSAGIIAEQMAQAAGVVVGVDRDIESLIHAARPERRALFAACAHSTHQPIDC